MIRPPIRDSVSMGREFDVSGADVGRELVLALVLANLSENRTGGRIDRRPLRVAVSSDSIAVSTNF